MGCQNSFDVSKPVLSKSQSQVLIVSSPKYKIKSIRINRSLTSVKSLITDHFKILRIIGTNRLGSTLYAQELQTGTFRAVREIRKCLLSGSLEGYNEISILKDFDHPNIVKSFQTIETSHNFYGVFEYLNGGSLDLKMRQNRSEVNLSKYVHNVINALHYIHLQSAVHCNLNPKNILLSNEDNDCIAKIIGFNHAGSLDNLQPVNLKQISYIYASPEMLRDSYNEKTDMWSLGVIVYEILVGKPPFNSKEKIDILKEIYNGEVDYENQNFAELSFNAQDLIKKLLVIDPELRISSKEALGHPWIAFGSKENRINSEAMMRLRNFKVIFMQIKTNITREILKLINSKLALKEHGVVSVFLDLDQDGNGFLSKEEIVDGFQIVGIDASKEIDTIMNNADIDGSGYLDFTEIKIALTDWEAEIKKNKALSKVLEFSNNIISVRDLKETFQDILPHEWNEFSKKTRSSDGYIDLSSLEDYVLSNLV